MHHTCCHIQLLGEVRAVHVAPLGENNWKFEPGFYKTLPYASFPLADFNLYSFPVINRNCEYTASLSSVSPSELPKLKELGDPQHSKFGKGGCIEWS